MQCCREVRVLNSQTYFDLCRNYSDPRVGLMRIELSLLRNSFFHRSIKNKYKYNSLLHFPWNQDHHFGVVKTFQIKSVYVVNPQIHLADRNGTGLRHTKYKGVSQFPDTNSWHVAMWWPSRWCIMSNSKHSEARRGEWPTQDAVWCKTCIPLYLCTLTPYPSQHEGHRSRLNPLKITPRSRRNKNKLVTTSSCCD